MKHICDDCGKRWTLQEVVEAKEMIQRVDPGGIMPSGQCPECGALCYPTDQYPHGKGIGIVGKTVYVALTSGNYGQDIFIHSTEEGLTKALYEFVKTYWEKPMGPRPRKDKEKAIDIYFEYMANRDEFLEYRGAIEIKP